MNKKEREKKWRENNPDKVKGQKDRYYVKHRDEIKQKSMLYYWNKRKKYIQENPALFKIKQREVNQKKAEKWRLLLNKLRIEKGGKCEHCGFCKEVDILQFHHLRDKKFEVCSIRVESKAREEAKKCILLCPNCHAIIHLNKIKNYV